MLKSIRVSLEKRDEDSKKVLDAVILEFRDYPSLFQIEQKLKERFGYVFNCNWYIVGYEALKEKEG